MSKILNYLKGISFISGDSLSAQLFRTYVVGAFNLLIGLFLNYIFQFLIFNNIHIPVRTYLTNIGSFSIGVIISYFLSRKIIFKLDSREGNFQEFINFLITSEELGVCSDGLIITLFPAARAPTSGLRVSIIGKFQGEIMST